jgi:hypothetical protein
MLVKGEKLISLLAISLRAEFEVQVVGNIYESPELVMRAAA